MKRSSLKTSGLAVAVAAATLCLSAVADFPNMPPLKEGLWKIRTVDTSPDEPARDNTVLLCRSHAYDDSVRAKMSKLQMHCATSSDSTVGNKRTISMSCDAGGFHTVSKSTLTMSENAYHTETDATVTMGGQTSTTKSVQDQTYMGACPAGMLPGDRKRADGTVDRHS